MKYKTGLRHIVIKLQSNCDETYIPTAQVLLSLVSVDQAPSIQSALAQMVHVWHAEQQQHAPLRNSTTILHPNLLRICTKREKATRETSSKHCCEHAQRATHDINMVNSCWEDTQTTLCSSRALQGDT